MDDKIKFKRVLGKRGDSIGVNLPPELIEWIQAKEGDTITLMGHTDEIGKYILITKEQ